MAEVLVDQEDMNALLERVEALSEEVAALRAQMAVPEAEPHAARSLSKRNPAVVLVEPEPEQEVGGTIGRRRLLQYFGTAATVGTGLPSARSSSTAHRPPPTTPKGSGTRTTSVCCRPT